MADINLKSIPAEENDEKEAFPVHHIEELAPAVPVSQAISEPSAMVKIQFAKFVELVARHSFIDVIEKNAEKEVIIDANLLADLANADEERETIYQRWTLIAIGLVMGLLIAYIILR